MPFCVNSKIITQNGQEKETIRVQYCRQIWKYQDDKINGLEISYKQKPANKTPEIQTGDSQ
jgi:hypothetical protein